MGIKNRTCRTSTVGQLLLLDRTILSFLVKTGQNGWIPRLTESMLGAALKWPLKELGFYFHMSCSD